MPTLGKLNTTLLAYYHAGLLTSHCNDASMNISMSARDVTTKESGGWRELLEGLRQATFTFGALMAFDATTGVAEFMAFMLSRASFTGLFSTEVTGDDSWSASQLLTELSVNSPGQEETASYSGTAEVTGAVTFSAVT